MALEVVDKKNPSLIRPASIVMVDEYEIKVLFIGWPEAYAYWVDDDSPDIHPPDWARKTGHPIESVPSELRLLRLSISSYFRHLNTHVFFIRQVIRKH